MQSINPNDATMFGRVAERSGGRRHRPGQAHEGERKGQPWASVRRRGRPPPRARTHGQLMHNTQHACARARPCTRRAEEDGVDCDLTNEPHLEYRYYKLTHWNNKRNCTQQHTAMQTDVICAKRRVYVRVRLAVCVRSSCEISFASERRQSPTRSGSVG